MSKEIKILIGIGIVVVAGGVWLFSSQPKQAPPGEPVDESSMIRSNSHMTGKADAKVTIVEFGDYECPACAAAEPIIEQLRQDYKDNPEVNFVFRNFPLSQHQKAMVMAQAAEAAGAQGKFWEMHDKIYLNQSSWIGAGPHDVLLLSWATELGLDVDKFKTDYLGQAFTEIIDTDSADGVKLGVNSTPTFFINGQKTEGFKYDYLKSLIEEKLK